MKQPSRSLTAVLLVALTLPGLSGCAGDPAVCADVDQLKSDLDALRDIELGQGALDRFSDQLQTTGSDVEQLLDDAAEEYQAEVDAVDASADQLRTSFEAAQQDLSATTISAVTADLSALVAAVDDLRQAVADTC